MNNKPDKKLFLRYALREALGLLVMGIALFWSAGSLKWWPAWATLVITLAWILATAMIILRRHPALLIERLGPRKGAELWDTVIVSMLGLIQLTQYIVSGLDHRYGWTGEISLLVQLIALLVCLLGYYLFIWALACNPFFSQVVRIQLERQHIAATGGPYRFVRHPAYTGAIAFVLAVSLLLASWWAFLVGIIAVVLLITRTILEDRTLLKSLPGYSDYASQVSSRLLPGIW